jgi:hypothetical protein
MAYKEYGDSKCSVGISYYDYNNYCIQKTVYSYTNCTTGGFGYYNYKNKCSNTPYGESYGIPYKNTHAEGVNYNPPHNYYSYYYGPSACSDKPHRESYTCSVSYSACYQSTYKNQSNDCMTKVDYTNYANTPLSNKGGPITLTWSSDLEGETTETIQESIGAIIELRDKVRYLAQNKGTNTVDESNIKAESGKSGDVTFDDNNPSTPELVNRDQFNAIRDALKSLFDELTDKAMHTERKDSGSKIKKRDIRSLKEDANTLAGAQANYANTVNYHTGVSYTDTYKLVEN